MERPTRTPKPMPTLLTKADAMLYAASQLREMSLNLELLAMISGVMKDGKAETAEQRESLSALRTMSSGIVDKDLQLAALKDAADAIAAMANEEKLVDARVAAEKRAKEGARS